MGRSKESSLNSDGRSKLVRKRNDIEMEQHNAIMDAYGTADEMYKIFKKHITEAQMRKIVVDLVMLKDPGHRNIISRLVAQHNATVKGTELNDTSRIFTRVVKVKPGPRPRAKKSNASV